MVHNRSNDFSYKIKKKNKTHCSKSINDLKHLNYYIWVHEKFKFNYNLSQSLIWNSVNLT